jgi:hypothetical protein
MQGVWSAQYRVVPQDHIVKDTSCIGETEGRKCSIAIYAGFEFF